MRLRRGPERQALITVRAYGRRRAAASDMPLADAIAALDLDLDPSLAPAGSDRTVVPVEDFARLARVPSCTSIRRGRHEREPGWTCSRAVTRDRTTFSFKCGELRTLLHAYLQ